MKKYISYIRYIILYILGPHFTFCPGASNSRRQPWTHAELGNTTKYGITNEMFAAYLVSQKKIDIREQQLPILQKKEKEKSGIS